MVYLDCAQYDCCHNKAGACCLGSIKVHHAGKRTRFATATAVTRAWATWLPTMLRPRRRPRSAAMTRAAVIWKVVPAVPIMCASTNVAVVPNAPPAGQCGKAANNPHRAFPLPGTPCFLRLRKQRNRCIIRRYSRRRVPVCRFLGSEACCVCPISR